MKIDFFKNIKLKFLLIGGLIILIIILFLISLSFQKPPYKTQASPSPFTSLKPSADIYSDLPSLPPNILPPDEQVKIEPIDDPLIGEEIKKIYTQRPWLNKLPLVSKSYIIVFDWEKESIRIRIIINPTSTLSREEQIAQIKNEVSKKLEEIGVDLTKEKIYYTFAP